MTLDDSDASLLRLQLVGYMHFPSDESMRDALIVAAKARAAQQESSRLWRIVSELIPREAQQGGIIAGETLIALLQLRASNIEPSLGKAQYLVNSGIQRQKRARDGRLPSSDRSLRNAWSEFKRVSHFWAALQLSREVKMRECDLAEHPQNFLSLAVALFDTTANLTRDQPLLDADTWLPAPGILPLQVSISPLADQQIESLKTYKPRVRD
jgi:hypothetical protein